MSFDYHEDDFIFQYSRIAYDTQKRLFKIGSVNTERTLSLYCHKEMTLIFGLINDATKKCSFLLITELLKSRNSRTKTVFRLPGRSLFIFSNNFLYSQIMRFPLVKKISKSGQ